MQWISGADLKQLRERLGISPERLPAYMVTSASTVRKYEKDGTTNRGYVECLLDLVKRSATGAMVVSPSVRGRPEKDWHLARPRRGYSVGRIRSNYHDYTHYAHRLFFPGAADHLRWLDAPPRGAGMSWLTREFMGDPMPDSLYSLTTRHASGEETVSEPRPFTYWQEAGNSAITKS